MKETHSPKNLLLGRLKPTVCAMREQYCGESAGPLGSDIECCKNDSGDCYCRLEYLDYKCAGDCSGVNVGSG